MQEKQRAEKAAKLASGAGAASGGSSCGSGGKSGGSGAAAANTSRTAGGSGSGPVASGGKSGKGGASDDSKGSSTLPKKQPAPAADTAKQVALFAHLAQYERDASLSASAASKEVHPLVLKAGLQMAEGLISGTSARMVAMLRALQATLADFHCPPAKVLSRELETRIKIQIQHLNDCRPKSLAMGDGIKWLKLRVAQVPGHLPNEAAKRLLCQQIDTYIDERIVLADRAISSAAAAKISPGETILVYARSHVVEQTLLHAKGKGVEFSVVVVDGGPRFEGRPLVARLAAAGIPATYALLHSVSYLMPSINKVLLGASSMLVNGTLVSRAGTALVAMAAHEHGVPVLVCCETFKFTERVLLDAICYNELGNPEELVPRPPHVNTGAAKASEPSVLTGWRQTPRLKLLNLMYDVTPMKYLTMIVTEAGVIPPTSVPVIIREDKDRAQLANPSAMP
jgi:translation initiation factor eIF-2B subunit delta